MKRGGPSPEIPIDTVPHAGKTDEVREVVHPCHRATILDRATVSLFMVPPQRIDDPDVEAQLPQQQKVGRDGTIVAIESDHPSFRSDGHSFIVPEDGEYRISSFVRFLRRTWAVIVEVRVNGEAELEAEGRSSRVTLYTMDSIELAAGDVVQLYAEYTGRDVGIRERETKLQVKRVE